MSRVILCETCGRLKPMHPEDVVAGWQRRRRNLRIVRSLRCDCCNADLQNKPAIAQSMWRGSCEPLEWEHHYGDVVS